MTTPLERRLIAEMAEHGSITFADYMERALYDPEHGYYADAVRAGWRGQFLTSPELDPLFGELWARALEQVWEACGSPEDFQVVEIGPGEGGLASSVLAAFRNHPLGEALTYRLVERSPQARARQRSLLEGRVEWSASVDDLPPLGAGCVIANEVLDNLPVHIFERSRDHLFEVWIRSSGDGLHEALVPPHDPSLERFVPPWLAEGHRFEVSPEMETMVAALAARLSRGALIFVDYGVETEELAARRGGTIVCYSEAGSDSDPLSRPGAKDVTHHVDWGALRTALSSAHTDAIGPLPQADVLKELGAGSIDEALRSAHDQAVAEGRGADAVRCLSRRQALGVLLDPGGLGGLGVMTGLKEITMPPFLGSPGIVT